MQEPIEHEFPEHPIWRDVRTWKEVRETLENTDTNHVKIPKELLPHPSGLPDFDHSRLSLTSGGNAVRHKMKGKWPSANEIYREQVRGWHLHVRVQDGYYRAELDRGNPDLGEYVEHVKDFIVRPH